MKPVIGNGALPALAAAISVLATAAPSAAQDAAGEWAGIIEPTPGTRLPLIVRIRRDDAGNLGGTLDSPTQRLQGLPLAEIAIQGSRLEFAVPSIGGTYAGEWIASAKAWRGEWRQAGMQWPLLLFAVPPPPPPPADWEIPADDEIARLIAERNAPRTGQGIVVGVLGPEEQRIVAGGTGAGAAVDGDTLFEIGSITKAFTALILADMVNKGEVSLDDPAEKYLPAGHRMPQRGGRQITLRDLATHWSGLPRDPANLLLTDPDGPFAGYTEEKLLAFLDGHELTRDVGSRWEYSNLGVSLLGYLLARAAGTDFETLLAQRITGPLGMDDTLLTLSAAQAGRQAPPFDEYMRPVTPWSNRGVLQGQGGIRSSASDMLTFADAVLDPRSPIAAAVTTALSVRVPGERPGVEQALGWQIMHPAPGREIVWHGGSTGGYRAMLALEPARGKAVVILANSAAEPSTYDLGLHILVGLPVARTPDVPPAPAPLPQRSAITLPAAELDKFVGRYDFGSGVVFTITRDGTTLRVLREGIPNAPALPILPETPLVFFWTVVDAQIRFIAGANGEVTEAEFKQGELSLMGRKVGR